MSGFEKPDEQQDWAAVAALADVTAEVARLTAHLEKRLPCDGGCNYNSGPEETCSSHGRPVREVWEIVDAIGAERDQGLAERDRARSTAVVLEQQLAEVEALHMVRVVVDEFGFRGVCSCGWRAPFALADRRDAAASAMVHGMRAW